MKRRVRILHPGYLVGTKGHSVLKKKTYIRKPLIEVDEFSYSKMPTSRRHEIDSLGSFHNAAAFSNAVMDDSYDLQAQSRGRDHRLMTQMNNALHTDSPLTSPLSSRSSNISQLQHNTHRSTRLDTDPLKTSKTLKPSKMADSFKPASQKLARLSEFLQAKPPATFKLSKKSKPSESLPLIKSTEIKKRPKPSESLQLSKMPDPGPKGLISGIERMSPVVEQARNLVTRYKTFGIDSKLDKIATSAITSPRDNKTDFFSVSPLSNYVKARWPEREVELDLPSSLAIESPKKDIYKNPYLDSDDEDYESTLVVKSKNSKPGDLLKALRKNRSPPQYTADEGSDDEDYAKGAYAIARDDEIQKPRLSQKYETDDSPNELALSHLVSAAALRARSVLENLTGLLGRGGLVNVEGDIKPYGGPLTTFRLHTPFQFQGPLMIGEKPAISVGDDSFERYIYGLQEKRKQERDTVEKDTRRMSKMSRSLAIEPPKQYSLRPIGYISGKNFDSFSHSVVPFTTKFDKTRISPSSKKVHFDEDEEYKPTPSLSRELVPFAHKGIEDEMALVPRRRKRYPVYEYTEDIPLKLAIKFPGSDDDDKERLSVIEKIRIKVSTDFTRAPKSAVAVLRASRRRPVLASKPLSIRTTYYPKSKEVPDIGPYYLSSSARYIPGRTKRLLSLYSDYEPNVVFVDSDAYSTLYPRSTKFRPSDPVYIGERVASRPFYRHRYYQPWYSGWRAVARGRYLRSVPRIYYGRAYPLPELNLKALLVGDDKLDDPDRPRLRKPRTRYYADKLNKMDDKEQLSSIMSTPISSSYKASKPPKPYPSYSWRAIRDVDGYTKPPTNIMSWQYRLESRLEPDDLIPKPSTYGTMRDQVRGVQDKLDRHRQLLDRYLEPGSAAAAAASSAADYEADPFLFKRSADLGERITPHANRAPVDSGLGESHAAGGGLSAGRTTEEGGADGTGKVSPLRKKLRKVICKSRHDPTYYDD